MAGSKFLNIDNDTTLAGNSDSTVSSQKAVKTYVDTGLEGKINTSEKGAASGVATLDSNTKVPIAQVPHSTSTSLGDSNTVVPTQGAVKSYIDNNLIPKNFGGKVESTNPQAPVSAETYGNSALPKGYFKNVNLLHTVKNYFYKADKNLYNSGTVTVSCSYDDVVSGLGVSMLNGSYDGHYTSINPQTDFPEKPFVWTILSSSNFEVSDVCNLFLTGHRLTGVVNATAYKLEVTNSYNSGTPTWHTLVDYSGSAVNLCQKHFRLYSPDISTSPEYHNICGVRLTISSSTSTVFELSQIMLLASRGTENVADGVHALDVGKGGKIVADVTIPTDKGSFIGNLTGTADKSTKDGDGNTISSTYLKKSGGTMTGDLEIRCGEYIEFPGWAKNVKLGRVNDGQEFTILNKNGYGLEFHDTSASVKKVKTNNTKYELLDESYISTTTTLGTSDTVIPSQNAVKTYVDAQVGATYACTFRDWSD